MRTTVSLAKLVPRLYAQHRPENVREKGSDAVRTNFATHMYSEPFARLARHPRMVDPVVDLFGEPYHVGEEESAGRHLVGHPVLGPTDGADGRGLDRVIHRVRAVD